MGLSNGGVGPKSVKGVAEVKVDGTSYTEFATAWQLKGEVEQYFDPTSNQKWSPMSTLAPDASLVWLKGTFDLPANLSPMPNGAQPNQTAVVLNLAGLNKGVAYVNGFNIGRYFLAPGKEAIHPGTSANDGTELPPGQCSGACAPPHHGSHCFLHYKDCGLPTQHLYHVPYHLLKRTGNVVVIFEEPAHVQTRDFKRVAVNVLRSHPVSN